MAGQMGAFTPEDSMNVHVRVLSGPFFDVRIQPQDTVGDLRRLMEEETGLPMESCRMAFQCRQMELDERLLVSYGVTEDSTVVVVRY
jgi:hypothetical protein